MPLYIWHFTCANICRKNCRQDGQVQVCVLWELGIDRDYLGECLLPYASMLSKLPFLANGIEGKMQSHCTFILH